MENKEWVNFWVEYGKQAQSKDPQTQVLRTINKLPIEKEKWEFCLEYIEGQLEVNASDDILDLCCGNGLISQRLSPKCNSVVAVDVSEDLLHGIDVKKYPNIKPICSDIRKLDFKEGAFSKIIIYAAIQYLSLKETVLLFENVKKWLRPGGIFFIGDIPDHSKRWTFFNSKEREAVYFNTVKEEADIVGTWFDSEWLKKLADYSGFKQAELIEQHPDMIYYFFRFDMKITN